MAYELILHGDVQGVGCRAYCSQYARRMGLRGAASNLRDGTVQVLLSTNNEESIREYVDALGRNPYGILFLGRINKIRTYQYKGSISGDYMF